MNEEIDDGDFYHQDFTTASEWEIFIARMEEIIHEWKVQDAKEDNSGITTNAVNWQIKSERIQFADVEFTLLQYKNLASEENFDNAEENCNDYKKVLACFNPKYDFVLSDGNDLGPEYSLEYWYGLQHFIILTTSNNIPINNESQIRILLSSINIVISNSGCEIPIFVQIREKWQRCYQGIYETDGVRTNFEMIHLKKGPQHCKYLTGLLDLFKTKIASPVSLESVTVSVQLSFDLSNWMNSVWTQDIRNDFSNVSELSKLHFGVSVEPINNLILNTTWSQLPEHIVVDSENYSDFDPLQAPNWSVKVEMTGSVICLLSEYLNEFVQLFNNYSSMPDLLGDIVQSNTYTTNPLDVLTDTQIPMISSVIKRTTSLTKSKSLKTDTPISHEILVPIIYFLFPDADQNSLHHYNQQMNKENVSDNSFLADNDCVFNIEILCRGLKTCNNDSLVWRLSIVLAHAMMYLGGPKAVAYLWYEFSQEMRYRWENSIAIPGLNPGFPDLRTCLLHQKLQMLNCCIERRKARESADLTRSAASAFLSESSDEDSEEEFYDCDADKPEDEGRKQKRSLWNKPVGRLSKHGNMKLLNTGEQLYIPVTQEPAPKTEDQLEEDTDVLLKLGTDAHGSELRARLMSASLLSDMESFKAANPDSILDDFIRWYSVRDWVEEDELDQWGQRKGHLSARMQISNNTWLQMWQSAKPVPAHRQKRLFDDTREAEKVLHFLDSRLLSNVAELIFPVLCHAAIYRLSEESEEVSQLLPETIVNIRHIIKTAERISREPQNHVRRFESLIQEISSEELSISQVNSLLYKLNPSRLNNDQITQIVSDLITGREVSIEGASQSFVGKRIIHMFSEAQKAANLISEIEEELQHSRPQKSTLIFPQENKREFVMRVSASRPARYSTPTSHMLRAIFSKNEFRLCGAFSEDITFF